MSAVTFDTLKYVERLTAAGLPEKQAKAEAEALREALGDLAELKSLTTKDDISQVRIEISDAKADIIKWMAGLMLAQAGLVAALVKLIM
ncbi:CCDC90 family protein [Thauera aromatica]|uniref:CCDC90 family protein n=1 Tax=Thauera aromatica TaxID=59405 RepID=UPI001FFDCF76|nr:CCDC90 family protein [Thauera aromatica]MCK2097710.1 CCDC90 family protein [Thauera aromatica]